MARLSYKARRNLPDSAFALPKKRKLPLTDAHGRLDRTHIGNAAARLSMMRHRRTISHADYLTAHRAIARAEKRMGMHGAMENPVGDFVHEHPWMTFFLGLAALNTVGWIAVLGIAAAKGSDSAPRFNLGSAIPIPTGTSPSVNVGSSLQMLSGGKPVDSTSDNAAVLSPAGGVVGGFLAVASGEATVSSIDGQKTAVYVVSSGALGTGKPSAAKAGPRFVPRILRVA